MKKITHLIFGFGLTYYVISLITIPTLLHAMVAVAFTILPDLDLHDKHRRALHNIFAAIIFSFTVSIPLTIMGSNNIQNMNPMYMFLTAITAYTSHLFLDSLTLRGIDILWPVSKRIVGLRTVSSNSREWNLALSLIGVIFMIISIL
jgi:inner membrane protein